MLTRDQIAAAAACCVIVALAVPAHASCADDGGDPVGAASGTDVVWIRGERYLVTAGDTFVTDDCSVRVTRDLDMTALTPAEARPTVPSGDTGIDPPLAGHVAFLLTIGAAPPMPDGACATAPSGVSV